MVQFLTFFLACRVFETLESLTGTRNKGVFLFVKWPLKHTPGPITLETSGCLLPCCARTQSSLKNSKLCTNLFTLQYKGIASFFSVHMQYGQQDDKGTSGYFDVWCRTRFIYICISSYYLNCLRMALLIHLLHFNYYYILLTPDLWLLPTSFTPRLLDTLYSVAAGYICQCSSTTATV